MPSVIDYSKWDNLDVSDDEEANDNYEEEDEEYGEPLDEPPSRDIVPVDDKPKGGIDYSKWDRFGDLDDEVENARPRVTRLDAGTTVQIGSGGYSVTDANQQPASASTSAAPAINPNDAKWEALSHNGSVTDQYYWSQTKDEVKAHILVPADVNAKNLNVTLQDERLQVSTKGESTRAHTIFSGKLVHPVHYDEEDGVDWELLDFPAGTEKNAPEKTLQMRRVQVTLRKRIIHEGMEFTPGESVVLWWRSLLEGGAQIDTTKIDGRRNVQTMQETWQQAQEMFREKMKNRKPFIIDPQECGASSDSDKK
mmetsp:Transcript_32711/g.54777  ORF Transcript_32711/g.54777 Transcript_32711/m.54777 type:complete len:309 (-) Transcript_32711:88-1014(-)|eukprot:CAMPEP_0198202282 /NCGR_PEP_ID=MMETSP1445-20131203/5414_1 /TAXON_ID=36898 /ORGANISM="Pyramimonas sp., Strain CCMP2087" /LENGTH=308 /DNA_ID=CAMNT_0043873121 /DNA_START=139 /DNA_END=1065 /DNA_ORIENTATION=-